jgi:hypothetical protein
MRAAVDADPRPGGGRTTNEWQLGVISAPKQAAECLLAPASLDGRLGGQRSGHHFGRGVSARDSQRRRPARVRITIS